MLTKTLLVLLGLSLSSNAFLKSETIDHTHNHEPTDAEIKGDKAVPNDDRLYIHLVSHTHDDVGWLKTVDEYYSGTNGYNQMENVDLILDSVIDSLIHDPTKKFTYVEMKFFSMWFYRQDEFKKELVRGLVREGRLEFVNAGWSMHDEANTHYEDQINNMMHGHQFLLKEFNYVPKVGWHIDPFGHSNANARLFAEMGFDAYFFSRIDYLDK